MRYCADTWFLLKLFGRDEHSMKLLNETQQGKDFLFVSMITYAETIKKLFQFGNSEVDITKFFDLLKQTEKFRFVTPEEIVAKEAAKISLTYSVPLVDSFVAATARIMNCDVLLSADNDYALLAKRKYIKVQSW